MMTFCMYYRMKKNPAGFVKTLGMTEICLYQ